MTLNMYIATAAWLCLVIGVLARRRRKVHVPFVLTGIVLDVGLVLYLQVTRDAVQTAMEFSLSWMEQLHILFSTLALVIYFPVLYYGIRLLLGNNTVRAKHRGLAVAAFTSRTIGFGFMFSLL